MINQYYFFDLDHTLIDTDSEWEWKNMLNKNKGSEAKVEQQKHQYFLDLHHHGKLPLIEYTSFLMEDFIGKQTKEISDLAAKSFNKNIKSKVFIEAKKTINMIQENKGRAIMLSGSFRPIVEPIAKYLGINDIVCTELEVIDDKYTGNLIGEFCVLNGKVNKAKEYCEMHGISLSDIKFYGDSHSDIPIMEQAGHATVVNPKNSMKIIATEQGWDTVKWAI